MKYRCSVTLPNGQVIDTWGVYPINRDTKVLDGVYNPISKELRLIFDSHIESYRQVEVPVKNKSEVQIRKVDDWYHGTLTHPEDITYFLHTYVANDFEYSYAEPAKIISPAEFNQEENGQTRTPSTTSNNS